MTDATLADPIEMEVFANRLLTITEEMGHHLVRSSFSANIKERRDCSVALFDARGRLIAQAAHIPIHLGSLLGAVEAVLAKFPLAAMREGDAFVCNDAYLCQGTHLPDISIVTPVFHDGSPRFFAACLGHHADVGGAVPGSISPDAGSIFEEGIRIPATRLVRAGELDTGLLELIAHNTREPEDRILDIEVQIATNGVGVAGLRRLIDRMGIEAVERAVDDVLAYTCRRLANRIAALGDGTASFTQWMDDDGVGGDPLPIRATVTVAGERLTLDFTGTGPQSRGGFNVMPSGVLATCAYAVKALLDPNLPPNSGLLDALDLELPEGSIVNPRFPAAVGARTTTCQKLAGAIFGAFRALLPPERAMASSHDVLAGMVFSGRAKRRAGTYVYLETIGGGNGARIDADGMDGAHCHITNSLNMPVEAVENEYPLLVEEYALVPDSGGPGRTRGGMGIAREVRVIEDGTTFSARADSFLTRAEGLLGGGPGGICRVVRNPGTPDEEVMPPKVRLLRLGAGERIRMETPGGGGFGPPEDRPPERLAADRADGRITE